MFRTIVKFYYDRRRAKTRANDFAKRGIYVRSDSTLGSNTFIGDGTNINGAAYISSSKNAPVKIGKYCAIAHNFRIRTRNHYVGYPNIQDKFQRKHKFPSLDNKSFVTIGNNVWIGDNVLILPGVEIGDGAVIGGGAVVTKNIKSYSVAVGNPAKVIKMRFSENIISQLMNIKWWNWSEEKIKMNKEFFGLDLQKNRDINLNKIIVDL